MNNEFKIGEKYVGGNNPAYIIAEAGANHNGDLSLAKELVKKAKEIGCDCIKFQTFTAEEFCSDPTQLFTYKSRGKDVTEPMLDLFKRLEFNKNQWSELINYCKEIDIQFMTTVQDPVNLEMLLELDIDCIKVGSDDFNHLINLRKYAKTGLPLIISRGMADLGEIDHVINDISKYTNELAILHCISIYPTSPADLNLRQILKLKEIYPEIIWGFSDHSEGILAPVLAVSQGAKIIEKHFTLDHDLEGPDHWFSMDIQQMKEIVMNIRLAEMMMGEDKIKLSDQEIKFKETARRRIVANKTIRAGEKISVNNVTFKRGSHGAFVDYWELFDGAIVNKSKEKNGGIDFDDISHASKPD